MAKQRRLPPPTSAAPTGSKLYQRELDAAQVMMERGNYEQAFDLLADLADNYPARTDILLPLLETAHHLGDSSDYAMYAEELLVQEPDHPDVLVLLGSAYIVQGYVALGISTIQQFLDRYPSHRAVAEELKILDAAHQVLAALQPAWPFDLRVRDERIRLYADRGEYAAARREAQSVLKGNPTFVPALLSLSDVELQRGQVKEAAAVAARILEFDANNLDALGMLVHYSRLLGNDAEARTYVERVRAVKTPNPAHRWLRLAEACSRFGDDAAVLQVGVDAGIERRNPRPEISPFLYHLVAVAALRQGDSKRARRLWQRALDLDPGLDIAAENLDDLEMPAEERNGPWAFYTDTWLGETLTDEMAESVGKLDPDSVDKQARREFERLLGRRPEIRAVLPIFMHMGDRYGCVTAAMMAGVSSLPEVRAALKEFVFGNHGPDDIRFLLADELARQREIPPGITVLWQEGKRTDVLLLGIAIDDSPDPAPLAKSVQSLADQAGLAMQAGRFDEAERKFREALALQPNQALLHYSVGFCALQAGRLAEAETQFRALLERAPNFLLSHVGLASVYLRRHEPEKAAAALAPLHEKTLLRVEEFSFLCQTEVDILLSQGKRDAARLWAEAWGEIVEGAPSFNDLVKSHQKLYGR